MRFLWIWAEKMITCHPSWDVCRNYIGIFCGFCSTGEGQTVSQSKNKSSNLLSSSSKLAILILYLLFKWKKVWNHLKQFVPGPWDSSQYCVYQWQSPKHNKQLCFPWEPFQARKPLLVQFILIEQNDHATEICPVIKEKTWANMGLPKKQINKKIK